MIHVLEIKQMKIIKNILKWAYIFRSKILGFYLNAFAILVHVEISIVHDI